MAYFLYVILFLKYFLSWEISIDVCITVYIDGLKSKYVYRNDTMCTLLITNIQRKIVWKNGP